MPFDELSRTDSRSRSLYLVEMRMKPTQLVQKQLHVHRDLLQNYADSDIGLVRSEFASDLLEVITEANQPTIMTAAVSMISLESSLKWMDFSRYHQTSSSIEMPIRLIYQRPKKQSVNSESSEPHAYMHGGYSEVASFSSTISTHTIGSSR